MRSNGLTSLTKKVFLFLTTGNLIFSCTKDAGEVPGIFTDRKLYELSIDSTRHSYYQSGATLSAAGNSPHGAFRLRFNSRAAAVLTLGGEIPAGEVFPDSSLIVKDILNGSAVDLYAVMYKRNGSWDWAEYKPGGDIIYGIGRRGGACISCHSLNPQRDYVRTFDLH